MGKIRAYRDMRITVVPELQELLHSPKAKAHPFLKSFQEAKHDPCVIAHTSGSTGNPKVIHLKHSWFTSFDGYREHRSRYDKPTWTDCMEDRRVLVCLPPVHSAGIMMALSWPLYYGAVVVYPHPDMTVTSQTVDAFHASGSINASMIAPSIIVELSRDPQALANASKMEYVGFGGGPLPASTGEAIKETVRLVNNIGATEISSIPSEMVDRDDWKYFKFSPLTGAQFRHAYDDLYEMVIIRNDALTSTQAAFSTFPDLKEYPTKDLYSPHPSNPERWEYRGRADDIVVLSNGEKFHPLPIENSIAKHPDVVTAIVTGNGRFQPALLIEPNPPLTAYQDEMDLREKLWPTIVEACEESPSHAKIAKDLVMFAKPEKPFLRTAKGSVRRQVTLKEYGDDLNKLFGNAMQSSDPSKPFAQNRETISGTIRQIVTELMGKDVDDKTNLLYQGMDSLKATNIARSISKALAHPEVESRMLYAHPSIVALTDTIVPGTVSPDSNSNIGHQMETLIDSLADDISRAATHTSRHTVILTGSTGSLGTYLLDALLRNTDIEKIYCLNRSDDAATRQLESFSKYGLETKVSSDRRCEWMKCDLSKLNLGLAGQTYFDLLQETTHVLHNAWTVDFNLPLSSFEDSSLQGVRQLAHFAQQSTHGAHFVFLSSISVGLNWPAKHAGSAIPERILNDLESPEHMGYAESKFVAEHVLEKASKTTGLKTTICRIGQIAGPVLREEGVWAKHEWFPSLITTSMNTGFVPEDLGPMDVLQWIPVDLCAQIIIELLINDQDEYTQNGHAHVSSMANEQDTSQPHATNEPRRESTQQQLTVPNGSVEHEHPLSTGIHPGAAVINVLNPQKSRWSSLLPEVMGCFGTEARIATFTEWVGKLKTCEETESNEAPAVKLLSFFEDLVAKGKEGAGDQTSLFDLQKGPRVSPTMQEMEPVNARWMSRWFKQWGLDRPAEDS